MANQVFKSLAADRGLENNLELLQQIGLLRHLRSENEASKTFYSFMTAARVGNEVYQRVSGKRTIDEFKKQCFANIAEELKKKPNAPEKEVQEIVQKEVALFAMKVKAL
jgi:hypothetical protein